MGIYRDRNKERSCSFVYGNSLKVCRKQSSGNHQKNTSSFLSRKFAFLKMVYWDRKGIWGKGYFVSTVGINEEVIRRYVQSQEKEETGQAKLELWTYHACKGVGVYWSVNQQSNTSELQFFILILSKWNIMVISQKLTV